MTRNQDACEKNGTDKENLQNHFEFFVVTLLDSPAQLVAFIEVQRNKEQFNQPFFLLFCCCFLLFLLLCKKYFRLVLQPQLVHYRCYESLVLFLTYITSTAEGRLTVDIFSNVHSGHGTDWGHATNY